MIKLLIPFILASTLARAQTLPSPEAFINSIYTTIVDTSFTHYYLIKGTDTGRFTKFDYDEWTQYHLKESVPLTILNDLSEKVYLARYPYFWHADHLDKAICIDGRQVDSIFSLSNPALTKNTRSKKALKKWQSLPLQEKTVFSFSLPQFTDDGEYAVIDLNLLCGTNCGASYTCIFRHLSTGWKLIGKKTNYTSSS